MRSVSLVVALLAVAVLTASCSSAGQPSGGRSDPTPAPAPSATPSEPPSEPPSGPPDASPDGSPAAFEATVRRIDGDLRARMRFSHRPGCPVPLERLRLLTVSHVRFDGLPAVGELVVHEDHARALVRVFRELYDAGWPIRRMRLVDEYQGDDALSMADDNTSAYNCRRVAGTDRWSDHAYGLAVDLNPVENPYVTGASFVPAEGARFARIDRSARADVPRGVIRDDDVVVRAFARIGWEWGGHWSSSKDYQHFSATGR
jgi:poly-gamma-glutamate synthesis protein (capsule biosynthesis protein)